MNLPSLSIRQPVLITMLMLALVVVGFLGFSQLSVDLMPDISAPYVTVTVPYPGAGPSEVEKDVAEPLEDALGSLNGVKNVRSTSDENVCQVLVEFNLGIDPVQATQDVRERVATVRGSFPTDVKDPVIVRYDTAQAPILSFGIVDHTGRMTPEDLRHLVDDKLQPRLGRIDGVADVTVAGGLVRQINVNLDLDAMRTRHVAPQQVTSAIQIENVNVPGGQVTQNGQDLTVRTPGYFQNVADLANIVVANPGGVPVYLKDVATVADGFADVDTYSRLDGQDTIAVTIVKQSGANTVRVADAVKAEMDRIRHDYPDLGITAVNDQSTFIKNSTQDSIADLVLGGLFASLVVLFFFRDLRNTLVTVAGLPVIMIGTFAVMNALNLGLNIMTLLALSLAVGLVIDDAIVVRENIIRHMERGETPPDAARLGTNEVSMAVLAMTLTVLSVFLPVAFTGGVIGIIFRVFGLTVAGAVAISLFEAFTLAPMLSAYFFKQRKPKAGASGDTSAQLGAIDRFYRRLLGWALAHKLVTAAIALALLASIVGVGLSIQTAFLPTVDNDYFTASLKMPTGTTLDRTDGVARQIETDLRQIPNVKDVFSIVGGDDGPEYANMTVLMTSSGLLGQTEPLVRQRFANVAGLSFSFGGLGTFTGSTTSVLGRPIHLDVNTTGGSLDELDRVSQQVMQAISGVPGLVDLDRSYTSGKPEVHVDVDRQTAARDGLSTGAVGSTVRTLVNGETVSRYRETDHEADIVVRLRPEDRSRLDDILGLTLPSASGQMVPLRDVATLSPSTGPSSIVRLNRQPQITVAGNYVGRSESAVLDDVNARVAKLKLPADITVSPGGELTLMSDSFSSLAFSMLLSVIFVYMVLASQFGSFTQPLVLMLALPLSFLGAFLALLIVHMVFDITAMIGLILLMGLVTKNSILLVDFANRLRAQGMERDQALLTAGPIRLRPILMTTLSLILGMLPVALGLGAGGSFRAPMAVAVIGGLVTSTLLTLVVVPVAYSLLDIALQKVKRAWQKETPAVQAPAE